MSIQNRRRAECQCRARTSTTEARTDGAASAEPSLLELCRVATEEDEVNASVTTFAEILKIYFVKSAKNLTIFQILTFYTSELFQMTEQRAQC
jgi:hypothetical protein